MNVVVSTEEHLLRCADGSVHSPAGVSAHGFWTRYLDVFDHVTVAARVRDTDERLPAETAVTGPGVDVLCLPDFTGPAEFLIRRRSIGAAWDRGWSPGSGYIFRLPGSLASFLAQDVARRGHPFGAEVVADPHDSFAPGASSHPLRPFFRWKLARDLRQHVAGAAAAAYVTRDALQRRYPPGPNAFATYYSDVELGADVLATEPRDVTASARGYRIATVGNIEQMYKRFDILIEAVAICLRRGADLRLDIVGDGRHRPELEALARRLGIGDRVCFWGRLNRGPELWAVLDSADLFVLPSQMEGLPRAMVEAMARALPCIGTRVGGIPELLPADALVPPGDASALANRIGEVLGDPARLREMSRRNLQEAGEFQPEVLRERRLDFLRALRVATERRPRRATRA